MKKRMLREVISQRARHVNPMVETKRFTWAEVRKILEEDKIVLQDDDILMIQFEEGYDEGDRARDPCYSLTVERSREETDEELKTRQARDESVKVNLKEFRRQEYLRLKEEFEGKTE